MLILNLILEKMTKKVNLICTSCAKHNGAEWRNELATANIMLGKCQVCGEVTPITHIHYWKNIHSEMVMVAPQASVAVDSIKEEKVAKVVAPKPAKGGKVGAPAEVLADAPNSMLE